MSSIMWWSVLAPKNLSVLLLCVELMSVVMLYVLRINDDVLNLCQFYCSMCHGLCTFVMKDEKIVTFFCEHIVMKIAMFCDEN